LPWFGVESVGREEDKEKKCWNILKIKLSKFKLKSKLASLSSSQINIFKSSANARFARKTLLATPT
jgi:hypothetical protein